MMSSMNDSFKFINPKDGTIVVVYVKLFFSLVF